jgi:hypothetical protein
VWSSGAAPSLATKPRYSSQDGLYGQPPVVTTPTNVNYAFGISTGQRATEYPDSSTTPTPHPNASDLRTAPSGYQRPYPDSTTQPAAYTYEAAPIGLTAPNSSTTPSGWPASPGIRRQYSNQTASPYSQDRYDEPIRRTAGSDFQRQYDTTSYFGGQNPVSAASMTTAGSYYQPGGRSGSAWSYEYDNSIAVEPVTVPRGLRQNSTPFGESTTSGYQNQDSAPLGSTARSGFGPNLTPTIRNPYPGQTASSVQPETSNCLPASRHGRPQSMYSRPSIVNSSVPQYESESPTVPEDNSVSEVVREMANSNFGDQSHRRNSVGMSSNAYNLKSHTNLKQRITVKNVPALRVRNPTRPRNLGRVSRPILAGLLRMRMILPVKGTYILRTLPPAADRARETHQECKFESQHSEVY